ncbi:MAG: hypothetical protein ACT4P8_10985 [Betaproteobacteria bacterium]
MRDTINARIPPRVEQKLAEYCTRNGVTRSEAVIRALDGFLSQHGSGESAYTLGVDLIPRRGARGVRSDKVRELARKAFRGTRAR